jgi:hypothetical protein
VGGDLGEGVGEWIGVFLEGGIVVGDMFSDVLLSEFSDSAVLCSLKTDDGLFGSVLITSI